MRTTVTIEDQLYQRALAVADPSMDKAELFREATKACVRTQAAKPLAALGGTDPVYLFVAHKGAQAVYSANAFYKPEGMTTPLKVWSYGILTLDANNAATFELVDFFDVCSVTMETVLRAELMVRTINSANKPGASNPLNIDCRDLYPLITRTFTLAF